MRYAAPTLALLALVLALHVPAGLAAPPAQRDDGLEQPLLAANMCGAGDAGETHFTIAATGDTFPHENIQAAAEANGYDYLFERVRPFLQAADLAYTNFDGAMVEGSPYTGYPAFNYSPQLATALKNAGITLVSTANNHIMDRGPEGLDATLKVFEQNGIQQHGTVPSAQASEPRPAYLPITLSRDGVSIKIGFLSFSWGTNGIPDPFGQVNLLWQSSEYGQQGGIRQEVLDTIAQARRETDFVVVAAHWGYEYQFYPDAVQVEGARRMADAGADVILGAQSHTLQPVDILDSGGRKTLVIYSLANFLASQGAYQDPYFSATSVVFYVGLMRQTDGRVRVSGYRYLPTVHVDNDTRPAPIPPQGYEYVVEHVRTEMRDPGGLRQLDADPARLNGSVEICPPIRLPDGQTLRGDFAQFFSTLGGMATRPVSDTLTVVGAPLGQPAVDLAGNCAATIVLNTERQRLEYHPDQNWPYRISGTQIGEAVFRERYPGQTADRRTDVQGGAIADPRFHTFFDMYGGVPAFGYPISGLLTEPDAAGQPVSVQYFERARMELVRNAAADAPIEAQVHLGALPTEYPGISATCPDAATTPVAVAAAPATTTQPNKPAEAAQPGATLLPIAPSPAIVARPWWLWPTIGLLVLVLLGCVMWGLQLRADMQRREVVAARRRKRLAAAAERTAPHRAASVSNDDLLRRLLDQ